MTVYYHWSDETEENTCSRVRKHKLSAAVWHADGRREEPTVTRSTSSSTVNVKSYMRARSWYYTRAAFVDTQELQYIIQESENRWARTDASGHKWTKPFTASVSTRLVAIRIAEIDFLMHWTSEAWPLPKTNSKMTLVEDWSKPCIPQIRSS